MQRRDFLAAAAASLAAGCTLSSEANEPVGPTATTSESSTTEAAATNPTTTLVPAESSPPSAPGVQAAATVDQGISFGERPFPFGVASGDPDSTSTVLWTGFEPVDGAPDVQVVVDVAIDRGFESLLRSEVVVAPADDAFTVKYLATDLSPGTTYFYRFRVAGAASPIGRTKTLPEGEVDRFGLAASSCQSRAQEELWDNHLRLADDDDVDAVVWLGDFIYERQAATLAQYRGRYAEARSDVRLHASSGAHPWFFIWDDHEVLNDYDASVDPERRAAAYRAWWEFTPTRLARPGNATYVIYRSVDIGTLMRLVLLDCRQYQTVESVLGVDQLKWLAGTLNHQAQRTLVASSLIMSSLNLGDRTPVYTFENHPEEQAVIAGLLESSPEPLIVSGDLHIQMELEFAPGIPELMAPPLSSLFLRQWEDLLPFLPLVSENVISAEATQGYLRLDITPASVDHTFVTS